MNKLIMINKVQVIQKNQIPQTAMKIKIKNLFN
jgi:hypothetical protein